MDQSWLLRVLAPMASAHLVIEAHHPVHRCPTDACGLRLQEPNDQRVEVRRLLDLRPMSTLAENMHVRMR